MNTRGHGETHAVLNGADGQRETHTVLNGVIEGDTVLLEEWPAGGYNSVNPGGRAM
jgi:hypothetical protein